MRTTRPRFRNRWVVLAGAAVLAVTAPAAAQTMSSGGAGSGFGGSSGGSSGGSGTGSTASSTASLGFAAGTMAGSTSSIGGVTPTTGGGRGGAAGGRGGASNGTSPGVSSSNLFYGFYANPLTAGLMNSTGTGTVNAPFGTALYSTLMTQLGTTGTTGTRGGAGGFGAGGTANVSSGMSLPGPQSTSRRMPTYSSTVRFRFNAPTTEQRRTDLQAVLARTSSLPTAAGIQVTMDGPVVVLRGQVADDDQRRLAENVLRLSPGVHQVRNELEVK